MLDNIFKPLWKFIKPVLDLFKPCDHDWRYVSVEHREHGSSPAPQYLLHYICSKCRRLKYVPIKEIDRQYEWYRLHVKRQKALDKHIETHEITIKFKYTYGRGRTSLDMHGAPAMMTRSYFMRVEGIDLAKLKSYC